MTAVAEKFVGRAPEDLRIDERRALAGRWVALELYSPATLPLRRIEAVGDSVAECVQRLAERRLDPKNFEFVVIRPPF